MENNVCTFFGHQDYNGSANEELKNAIENLILEKSVTEFYVGQQGNFDSAVLQALRALKAVYPHIRYGVVRAYLRQSLEEQLCQPTCFDPKPEETVFPEGLESVPPRFAISRRNDWMLKQAGFVIAYVNRSIGGAAKFVEKAERAGKTVINLAPELSALDAEWKEYFEKLIDKK